MTDTPVIYENPKYPLPDGARWLSKDNRDCVRWYKGEPTISRAIAGAWEIERVTDNQPLTGYDIPGPWQDSLRRIVRLSEKAYYTPENPHTTGKGLLPHDGGVMPKWLEGKTVVVKLRDGTIHGPRGASAYMWCKSPCDHTSGDIIAYRIVGEQEAEVTDADGHVGKVHPEDRRREQELSQEQEDVEEGLALLRKHSWDLYEKSGASENGDDPEQFVSGNPVPSEEHARPLNLEWGENDRDGQTHIEWHSPCGCAFHPEPAPHIHPCKQHREKDTPELPQETTKSAAVEPPLVDKPRSPSDATYPREAVQRAYEHGYRDGVDDTPGGPPAERRHRNTLAAHTLTPVPGMDSFMHDVIREARRGEDVYRLLDDRDELASLRAVIRRMSAELPGRIEVRTNEEERAVLDALNSGDGDGNE